MTIKNKIIMKMKIIKEIVNTLVWRKKKVLIIKSKVITFN